MKDLIEIFVKRLKTQNLISIKRGGAIKKFLQIIDRPRPSFSLFFTLSIAGHALILLSVWLFKNKPSFFKKKDRVFQSVPVRIDQIGLPDFPKEKPKKKAPSAPPKKAKKKLEPPPKKPKKARPSKKAPQPKPAPDQQKTASPEQQQNPPSSEPNKGNQLLEGKAQGQASSLQPDQILQISAYMSLVEQSIKAGWNLPIWLADQSLKVQIEIQINSQGDVIYRNIVSSSGSGVFDGLALKAVENAGPYPPPPAEVKKLVKDGVVFTLHSRQ